MHDFESVFDTLRLMGREAEVFKWQRAEVPKSRILGVPAAHQKASGGWLFHFKQPRDAQQPPHSIVLTADLQAKIIQKHRFFYIYKKGRMYQFEVSPSGIYHLE